MDISLPDRPLWRMVWGAVEGAVLGALVYAVAVLVGAIGSGHSWQEALWFIAAGLVVCALAQYVASGILGTSVGLVVGILFGSVLGEEDPRPALAKHHLNLPAKLSGITLEGKPFDIETRRGKVVLVDFWATWCMPCREELPRLKRIYDRYHDDGLEVIGVSLDTSKDKVSDFVKREGISWPQIYTDIPGEQGWENPLLYQYTVRSIPYTLLVDRKGTIVASGLIGSSLEDAVENVMVGGNPPRTTITAMVQPAIAYLAAIGCLAGMLVERRLRQVWSRPLREAQP
jgi:thiol-disulfide isomerase/thioredoxin